MPGIGNKISLKFKKCAISYKSQLKMADLAGTKNRKGLQKTNKTPSPHAREKSPRHKSIPEIAVRCYPPRKTSQLTGESEEGPER